MAGATNVNIILITNVNGRWFTDVKWRIGATPEGYADILKSRADRTKAVLDRTFAVYI
jgi:hypothetical protein